MHRHDDVTSFLQQSVSPFDQRVVSKFLKIRPKILGVLEISIGITMLVLTIWTGFLYLLWSCLIGVALILLVFCDALVFIISVIVASSSCDCCRMKSRHVAVSCINRDVPYMTDNNIVLHGQQGPFAPPPNYDPSPSEPPPKYHPSAFAPPLKHDPYSYTPPANYNPSPSVSSPNDNPSPSAPPPNYDQSPSALSP
ncbi:uncharacterized protein LOC127178912 isoform X2 [Labeo rohita]|uniref:uncharacterized protein LOC127178912 isoform X2 n=1 Tax=Labeo rohita TaxID=84645 RepID=UPI0021E33F09|nr:uncharacterized protein LOC127178912 isoform X2 [Labeo rohita]